MLFLEGDFHFSLAPQFWLEAGVLVPEFLILVVLHLDHAAQFLLLLGVLEEVVLHFAGLAVGVPVLLLPVVDLLLEAVVGLLHLGHHLLVLVDLDLVVLVVVDLGVQFQLLLLELGQLLVAVLQQVVQLLQLGGQQSDLVLVVSHLHLDALVLRERALYLVVADAEVVELARLILEQVVEALDLLGQVGVVPLEVLELVLALTVAVDVVFQFADDVLELFVLLDLVAAPLLERLLVLLDVAVVVDGDLEGVVPALPVLDLPQPGLEDAVDAVVLDLEVVDLGLVVVELVFKVLVLGELCLALGHLLLPLVDFVQLAPEDAVEAFEFLGGEVELVAQLLVVVF